MVTLHRSTWHNLTRVNITLHARQEEIFHDTHRYKVVAAGRRFGKSYLAAIILFVEASKNEIIRSDGAKIDLLLEEVYYVAPTFEQGKKIMWPLLKELGHELIDQKYENTGTLTLINGRRISIKGADRPDSLRGVGLSYVVLDEYAFMKEEVWETIISPCLTRSEGGALFIGTPDGKNHFYNLFLQGMSDQPEFSDWKSWHFPSTDNIFLNPKEIAHAKDRMSVDRFRQEYEASFESGAGIILTRKMFPCITALPYPGDIYIACDLAGFEPVEQGRHIKRLDDHAIAVVLNHANGWAVIDMIYGQWDVRKTALIIVKAYRDHRPVKVGIEKGIAKNAVMPYLLDEMNRLGTYFNVEDLTHGNQKKTDRIAWALQGRADKGRIQLMPGDWHKKFFEQAEDFPNPRAHDDLIDALAYIDQLATPWYDFTGEVDTWEPLDNYAGY
jgi:predicted phage terminase large subunit-like protein